MRGCTEESNKGKWSTEEGMKGKTRVGDLETVSDRQWWTGHEFLVALYGMQRLDMEAEAEMSGRGNTDGLRRMMGHWPKLRNDDGTPVLGLPMAVVQAFALEMMLKSLLSREGRDTEDQKYHKHQLKLLYEQLSERGQEGLQREYAAWVEQARMVIRLAGGRGNPEALKDLDRDLRSLLERHNNDFLGLRYQEAYEVERVVTDRLNMFLAVCAGDAMAHHKMKERKGEHEPYLLSGTTGRTRNEATERAKDLIVKYIANGGQDLADPGSPTSHGPEAVAGKTGRGGR